MYKIYITIYQIIIYSVQPLIWIRLLYRSKKNPSYRKNWLERYGYYSSKKIKKSSIVLHAVSLGETLAAAPLIKTVRQKYPNITITLTSMTPSGLELAQKLISDNTNYIQCMYLPYDLPGAMKRFITKINPKLVIIMETELWPNFINILHQRNIPIIIANARLSKRSFNKYKKIFKFFVFIMQRITVIAAQYKSDANYFFKLGIKKNQLYIIGNLKHDITISKKLKKQIKFLKNTWVNNRLIWIASSTHVGEEILLLTAHKKLLKLFPNLLMILAPRHPERFAKISQMTKNLGLSYIMKSEGTIPKKNTQVIINDTLGELMLLYGISDIAFIGGSLIPRGGHNPLEPAIYAIPLISGPYTFNFSTIYSKLKEAHGLIDVTNVKSLIKVISTLLDNKNLRIYHGKCAFKVFKNNQGALQELLQILDKYLLIQK